MSRPGRRNGSTSACYDPSVDFGSIDFNQLVLSITVLLFSLSLHEAAHAWSAERLGDPTGRDLGRVTLNPLVHIDLFGTILFPLIASLSGYMFGWAKPVPVNVSRLRDPRLGHVLVALAGPLSNVAVALVCLGALRLIKILFYTEIVAGSFPLLPIAQILSLGLMINVILAVFNLIPIPPLDGSWVLYGLLPEPFPKFMDTIRPYSFVLLILLAFGGYLSAILTPVIAFVGKLAS